MASEKVVMPNKVESNENLENGDSEWGCWVEPEETQEEATIAEVQATILEESVAPNKKTSPADVETINRRSSYKDFHKSGSGSGSRMQLDQYNSLKKGITSSPSFQELEKAIGATIALGGGGDSYGDLQRAVLPSRNSRNDMNSITQHKMQQQRMRQQRKYLNNGMSSPPHVPSGASARVELSSFVNESESRAIILFHSQQLSPVTVRDACQKFGVLYYIRPEFHGKGVTLLSYFDLRSATHAYSSLTEELGASAEASAHYSVMLHAANNNSDEFRLVVKHLPPESGGESEVQSIFSRYGQLRSIQRSFGDSTSAEGEEPESEATSYTVEYYNIQDARLAASELCATSAQLWGPETKVSFAPLDSRKQQLCQKLLATLSRWRAELANNAYALGGLSGSVGGSAYAVSMPMQMSMPMMGSPHMYDTQRYGTQQSGEQMASSNVPMMMHPSYMQSPIQLSMPMMAYSMPTVYQQQSPHSMAASPLYSSMTDSSGMPVSLQLPPQQNATSFSNNNMHSGESSGYTNYQGSELGSRQQRTGYGQNQGGSGMQSMNGLSKQFNGMNMGSSVGLGDGQSAGGLGRSVGTSGNTSAGGHGLTSMGVMDGAGYDSAMKPPHHNGGHASGLTGVPGAYPYNNGHGHGHAQGRKGGRNGSNAMSATPASGSVPSSGVDQEFALDIERLQSGEETRTTVMVRNIPNKYNQVMLLDEVNVRHEGTYDFFYLPIDFKNKCNVGYCFINFLEPRFIVPFVQEFNGQRWRSFNSEKVCVVSFARIQGKAAMVSRFQNSSLLEKDDEYRPLLFYSSGPEKGYPEPFPAQSGSRHGSHGVGMGGSGRSRQGMQAQAQAQAMSGNYMMEQQMHMMQQMQLGANMGLSSASSSQNGQMLPMSRRSMPGLNPPYSSSTRATGGISAATPGVQQPQPQAQGKGHSPPLGQQEATGVPAGSIPDMNDMPTLTVTGTSGSPRPISKSTSPTPSSRHISRNPTPNIDKAD